MIDKDMDTFELAIDNEPTLKFNGILLGEVSSYKPHSDRGRWSEIYLYQTQSSKYVCHVIGRSVNPGEHDRFSGAVCEDIEAVKKFLGFGWLAKELYDECGISTAQVIE